MSGVQAGTVVTNQLISQTTQTQTNIPVTFGQIFKAGDVPSGETVSATLNGQPITLQVDAKATNPDGSLRHAVLTALIPSLAGDVTEPLAISTASPATPSSPVTLTQLLATSFDATASLNIGGTVYSADAKALLQAAQTANSCKPLSTANATGCTIWLSGPLVSEWIVGGPVKISGGSANPNINVYFNVRAYAGTTSGSIAYARVNIVVENAWAYTPQVQPQYTATLTSGSATYTSPALTQYAYTRWHQVLWWNNVQPSAYLQADTQYIQSTGVISRYEVLQPDDAFLSGLIQSCAPLDYCDQTQHMGNEGAQAAIGPLPQWTSVYVIDPDIRAYNWMLANTDALGAYSIHYRDQTTGEPVSIIKHPYVTMADWANADTLANGSGPSAAEYKADLLPNCVNDTVVTGCSTDFYGTGNPDQWDNAHQPDEGYVPYIVTGSFYYMEEMAFGASNNEIWSNETYRGLSQGLIDAPHSQVRGKAWVLREMADAAYLLPDTYPLKTEFTADVNNSLNDFNSTYTNNPNANALGIMNSSTLPYSMNGGTQNAMAPWQDDFLTWSAGHAAELGFTGASAFRDWLAKFQIGLMTDWLSNPSQGYCWLEASAYNVVVRDSSGNFLSSMTAVYGASFPSLVGLSCNSPAMVAAIAQQQNQPWQAGEMVGYPSSTTGFPANLQVGIAAAADSSLPNAQAAWQTFQGRSVQPNYSDGPQFAVLPRYLPSVPIVNIYASPNAVAAAGSSTTLYWSASNAASCSAKWTSSIATSGKAGSGTINGTTTYPITCTGPHGTTNASVSVSIASAAAPPPSNPPPSNPPPSDPSATKAGGGAMGWFGLVFLMGLLGWSEVRRRSALKD
ncbi:MAG: hypothetical protein ACRESE_02245 [Gammaproteobacteria bacterium]